MLTRRYNLALIVASLLAGATGESPAQTADASVIWIKSYGSPPAVSMDRFGNRIGNTFGMDNDFSFPDEYREQEVPPGPPGFDVVWKSIRPNQWGPGVRGLIFRDIRDYSSPFQKDTFKLSFVQADNESTTISFKWASPTYLSTHCDSLILKYTASTVETTVVDMFAQDSLTIPLAGLRGITVLWIYKSGIRLVETDVADSFLPPTFSLSQNYPNPFNPMTDVRYQFAERSHVLLRIYDVLGREVATLVNEVKPQGEYTVHWDAGNAPSGVYFYRVQAGEFVKTKKMILMR